MFVIVQSVRSGAGREDGGVLVLVALFLPVLILFITFVVDVGNWFEHKRHLQMQADAGALAGGGLFTIPCSDAPITEEARKYAGDPADPGAYNRQIGAIDQQNVHVLINSDAYWNEGGTDYSDGGPPCSARAVDVKITESNLPWFFGLYTVPAVNAHARVEVRALNSYGALPVAVPEVNPVLGRVTFVNEDTNAVLATTAITKKEFANGMAVWDNSEAPVPVPIDASRIGVRVALSGGASTTCGDPLVACYDLGSSNGILFARGWSSAGNATQPNPPVARSVTLVPGTCPNAYFSAEATTCTIAAEAVVDFGVANPATVGARVTAVVAGRTYTLAYSATAGVWQSAAEIPVPPDAGPIPVELRWEETAGQVQVAGRLETCSTGGGNKCKGTFGTVQRTFSAATPRSGPIELAELWENGSFGVNSFAIGTTRDLVVKIGIQGTLENASSVDDPVVTIRVTGSQNQSVDCDPNLPNLRSEIAQGCTPLYTRNAGTDCPSTASSLWSQPEPWSCVAIQTGGAVGQVEQGMRDRILGGANSCTSPNNWSQFPNIPSSDPRVVPIFLTPFGTFQGSGNEVVPVTGFATFYVTGWFGSPCVGDDPVPERGHIVGHFIKYVYSLNEGGGSEDLCDFSAIGSCIAVLVE